MQLVLTNVAEALVDRLRAQAERHGRSLEDEVVSILDGQANEPGEDEQGFGRWAAATFGGALGDTVLARPDWHAAGAVDLPE